MHRFLTALLLVLAAVPVLAADRPNVILIMSDDQGYGEIAAHGNKLIHTPNLDQLYKESVRLTNYHVDPTCSPTRSALMTGRYSTRTGVWHTINGRSMMSTDEYSMAEYFRDNGYRTAMFGKWHLGDNAPCRPMDQGFEYAVWHQSGGVTQGSDYFTNDYFDDTYKVNDKWQKFEGYCTDVWFAEAKKYIESGDKNKPFFVYMPTNAPHGPYFVDEKYSKPYAEMGIPESSARFYGMIQNIDENVGKLREWLKEKGLDRNTIFIYTTDNGTAAGVFKSKQGIEGFNAGMRGVKGSEYEGGHRVPFFIHWPAGGIVTGRDIGELQAHIDVMPTLGALCGLPPVDAGMLKRGPQDGRSFRDLLYPSAPNPQPRTLFVHSQRTSDPIKWRKCSVMTEQYRLVNGKELYDIVNDPGQKNDIAADHAEVVKQLRGEYENWWQSLSPVFDDFVRYDLGGVENPTTLMSHDWLMKGEEPSAWHHNDVTANRLKNGPFMVNIVKAGKYRITPMRWPEYVDKPSGFTKAEVEMACENSKVVRTWADGAADNNFTPGFDVELPAGPAKLTTTLTREDGKTFGAYYVKVEYLGE